jgi:Ser/Thr protein kinase RdoA (MazF antagonist)
VHNDLNSDNILITPEGVPAFLDFTPRWYPPAFALAVFAYWIGPARSDQTILNRFVHNISGAGTTTNCCVQQ